ncbi:hypothetical protein DFP72DRAFT_897141 [Ephemerocybe angulata]|uniref:F-box domain-containing protein n=1 Tax=Ephemerocybe angulata TaxID=980116 RepID=A0A8H6I0D7_9AGAR|nr:hypothetical protein DFP72DRAFT_897141 [Tulosesus angulatus]
MTRGTDASISTHLGETSANRPGSSGQPLLIVIAGELEWEDILRLRKVNRALSKISRSRDVWQTIYLRYLGTRIPRPYFLPKPLHVCGADDLEKAVVDWEAEWPKVIPTKQRVLDFSLNGMRQIPNEVELVPGGRWILWGHPDGSVSYSDLEDNSGNGLFNLLISPPFDNEEPLKTKALLAVDYATEQEGNQDVHHLRCFRIAVATCRRDSLSGERNTTQVDVWCVEVAYGDNGQAIGLRVKARLATFQDYWPEVRSDRPFALRGNFLAYGGVHGLEHSLAVVLDWTEANGKMSAEEIERVYIPNCRPMILRLLPGSRILVVYEHTWGRNGRKVVVYDWGRDGIRSAAPLITELHRHIEGLSTGQAQSVFFGNNISILSLDDPNETRFVLKTFDSIQEVRLPQQPPLSGIEVRQEEPVVVRDLPLPPVGGVDNLYTVREFCGYQRSGGNMGARRYSWANERRDGQPVLSLRESKVDFEVTERFRTHGSRLFFDEISGRVVLLNAGCTQLVVVDLLGSNFV